MHSVISRTTPSGRTVAGSVLAVSLVALLFGCGRDAGRTVSTSGDSPPAAATNLSALKGATTAPFDEKADARKDIALALTQAKKDGKFVLLDFGANWCPDCIMLSRLFEDGTVKPYLTTNFHLVKINVGRFDQNQDLCAEYGQPTGKGIPAVVVLNLDGHILASTRDGQLANARTATAKEILDDLKRWRATGPKL